MILVVVMFWLVIFEGMIVLNGFFLVCILVV